jgi:hypothetical protein
MELSTQEKVLAFKSVPNVVFEGLIPTLNDNRSVSAPKGEATRSPWQRRGFDPLSNHEALAERAPHEETTLSDGPGR